MAKKRQKTTRFSIQSYDAAHYRQTEQYTQAVEALFDRATAEVSKAAAKGTYNPDKPFSFDDYPGVKSVMQDVTKQLASRMTTVIETGSKKQWLFACDKNDGFIESIMDTSKVSKARLKKMQDRNLEALQTFQQRKVEGMNLSQRVWKYVGQYKDQLESALDVGLGEGRSADQLSRDVRENLKEPNRLFRRVRDKRGNLVLSKAARAFHPGQGVYRSSYKNAMRLTRSEINMAYRESDFLRWQSLDFVVGFEIHRSNHEPLCKCDLCERLVGRYPKTFKFKGWHPQCMCYATPILMDEETFDENEFGDLKAALRGTKYKPLQAKNVVTDVPDEFKKWVKDHIEAQKNWGSTPYFIKDNFKDGKLSEGLKIDLPKPTVQNDGVLIGGTLFLGYVPATFNSAEQKEWIDNHHNIEARLNVKQGKEMSFNEANELRGNENYVDATNTPREYTVNCQSCVVANELRRRGFDVTAQANFEKIGSIPDTLSKHTELAWLDKDGNTPKSQRAGGRYFDANYRIKSKTYSVMMQEFADITKSPGRYHIAWGWKNSKYGHIITAERLPNGGLRIYDPQNGKIIKDFKTYAKRFSLASGIRVLRVDDLRINTSIINGVVKESTKK
jgi:hypothetical protein